MSSQECPLLYRDTGAIGEPRQRAFGVLRAADQTIPLCAFALLQRIAAPTRLALGYSFSQFQPEASIHKQPRDREAWYSKFFGQSPRHVCPLLATGGPMCAVSTGVCSEPELEATGPGLACGFCAGARCVSRHAMPSTLLLRAPEPKPIFTESAECMEIQPQNVP